MFTKSLDIYIKKFSKIVFFASSWVLFGVSVLFFYAVIFFLNVSWNYVEIEVTFVVLNLIGF